MPEACGGFGYSDLDHCVQVVGYDDSAPEPYFKVRTASHKRVYMYTQTTATAYGRLILSTHAHINTGPQLVGHDLRDGGPHPTLL